MEICSFSVRREIFYISRSMAAAAAAADDVCRSRASKDTQLSGKTLKSNTWGGFAINIQKYLAFPTFHRFLGKFLNWLYLQWNGYCLFATGLREATFQNGRFFCSYSKGEKLQSLTLCHRLKYVSAKQGYVCLCTVVTAINNLIWTLEPSLTMRWFQFWSGFLQMKATSALLPHVSCCPDTDLHLQLI